MTWQLHRRLLRSHQASCSGRRHLYIPLSRPSHHRPHSLPVQWVHVRHPDRVPCPGEGEVWTARKRTGVCCAALHEAHLCLSSPSVLCLLVAYLLSFAKVHLSHSVFQLCQARYWHSWDTRRSIRSLRYQGTDPTDTEPPIPFFARLMPCLLGTQCLGDVLFHGPHLNLR